MHIHIIHYSDVKWPPNSNPTHFSPMTSFVNMNLNLNRFRTAYFAAASAHRNTDLLFDSSWSYQSSTNVCTGTIFLHSLCISENWIIPFLCIGSISFKYNIYVWTVQRSHRWPAIEVAHTIKRTKTQRAWVSVLVQISRRVESSYFYRDFGAHRRHRRRERKVCSACSKVGHPHHSQQRTCCLHRTNVPVDVTTITITCAPRCRGHSTQHLYHCQAAAVASPSTWGQFWSCCWLPICICWSCRPAYWVSSRMLRL